MLKTPGVMPGGWAFEFRNDFYPDVDDTAFVLMALQRVDYPDKARMEAAVRRGLAWLLAMQNDDGGWGAFDHNNDRQFLCQIPFADHNAMIDPSTADVTARVVECLGRYGWPATHPVIERAVRFLAEGSDGRRAVVRALGRELRLWNERRAARARNRGADGAGLLPARGRMAALGAKFRRRIRRIHRFLLRSGAQGQGREHGVPDRLGTDRIAGCSGCGRSRDRARREAPGRAAASRRFLG